MIHKIKVTMTKTINVAGISPNEAMNNTVYHLYKGDFSLNYKNAENYTIKHIGEVGEDFKTVSYDIKPIYGQFDKNIQGDR